MKQCTSLLSSPTSLLISPENAYLHSLILPSSQYSEKACKRAFGIDGRMKAVASKQWKGGYSFNPFKVSTTNVIFGSSRNYPSGNNKILTDRKEVPCNISAIYHAHPLENPTIGTGTAGIRSGTSTTTRTPSQGIQDQVEALVNGVLQGRKQSDARGRSSVSRRNIWIAILAVIAKLGLPRLTAIADGSMSTSIPARKNITTRSSVGMTGPSADTTVTDISRKTTHDSSVEGTDTTNTKGQGMSYEEFKDHEIFQCRKEVKAETIKLALKGWIPNDGDDFCL